EELEAVEVHQERDRGAVRAAAEAMVELLGRRHGERCRALVVERAARRVLLALALERHARAADLDDVGARQQVVDEGIGDAGHAQDLTSRSSSNVCRSRRESSTASTTTRSPSIR